MLLSPALNGYLASLSCYARSPAEMLCVQQGCRMSWLGWLVTMEQSPKQLVSLWIVQGDSQEEGEMAEVFPLLHCSAYHALLTSDRPYWSPRISRKKHMENLGLGYLAHCQLSLWAEMKEMGRTAPSLSSGGGCTSLSLSLYLKEKRRRSLKLGQLHRFIGQNQAQR